MNPVRLILFLLAFAAAAPAMAEQPALQQRVAAELAEAPVGTRFGLVVAAEDGRELIAIEPNGRFIPASNTKLLTTAAAFATMIGLDQPDAAGGAEVRLVGADVILTGRGDARLSSASDCLANCLSALADAVAARTRRVRNIVGDDSLFVDQRWSPGMSWNNIPTRSGTGISALTLDDNELPMLVSPGQVGRPASTSGDSYYRIVNRTRTVAQGETKLEFARMPGSFDAYLTGTILLGAQPQRLRLAIDDPAHYAAWRLRELLQARGVRITGTVSARHRLPGEIDPGTLVAPLARLVPPPLGQDLARINKVSQNVAAELLIRRVGLSRGGPSIEAGVEAVAAMLAEAGVPRTAWDMSDGSGMSTYNRVGPRVMVKLLRWAAAQPWGDAFRATLPIAGVDGTLTNRFRGTPLERRLFAKTGSLNATNALSGYLVARSGRELTFAFFANDVPGSGSATAKMDEVLNLIAAEN